MRQLRASLILFIGIVLPLSLALRPELLGSLQEPSRAGANGAARILLPRFSTKGIGGTAKPPAKKPGRAADVQGLPEAQALGEVNTAYDAARRTIDNSVVGESLEGPRVTNPADLNAEPEKQTLTTWKDAYFYGYMPLEASRFNKIKMAKCTDANTLASTYVQTQFKAASGLQSGFKAQSRSCALCLAATKALADSSLAGMTLNTCSSGMNAIGQCLWAELQSPTAYRKSMTGACNAAWMSLATPARWAALTKSELQDGWKYLKRLSVLESDDARKEDFEATVTTLAESCRDSDPPKPVIPPTDPSTWDEKTVYDFVLSTPEGRRLWRRKGTRGFVLQMTEEHEMHRRMEIAAVLGDVAVRVCGATKDGARSATLDFASSSTKQWLATDFLMFKGADGNTFDGELDQDIASQCNKKPMNVIKSVEGANFPPPTDSKCADAIAFKQCRDGIQHMYRQMMNRHFFTYLHAGCTAQSVVGRRNHKSNPTYHPAPGSLEGVTKLPGLFLLNTTRITTAPFSCPLRTLCNCLYRDAQGTAGCFVGRTADFSGLTAQKSERKCAWATGEDASAGVHKWSDVTRTPATLGLAWFYPEKRTGVALKVCDKEKIKGFSNQLCQRYNRNALCPDCAGGSNLFTMDVMRRYLSLHHGIGNYLESLWLAQRLRATRKAVERTRDELATLDATCEALSADVLAINTALGTDRASMAALSEPVKVVSYTVPTSADGLASRWSFVPKGASADSLMTCSYDPVVVAESVKAKPEPKFESDEAAIAAVANGVEASTRLQIHTSYRMRVRCSYDVGQDFPRVVARKGLPPVVRAPACGNQDDPANGITVCRCPTPMTAPPAELTVNVNVEVPALQYPGACRSTPYHDYSVILNSAFAKPETNLEEVNSRLSEWSANAEKHREAVEMRIKTLRSLKEAQEREAEEVRIVRASQAQKPEDIARATLERSIHSTVQLAGPSLSKWASDQHRAWGGAATSSGRYTWPAQLESMFSRAGDFIPDLKEVDGRSAFEVVDDPEVDIEAEMEEQVEEGDDESEEGDSA